MSKNKLGSAMSKQAMEEACDRALSNHEAQKEKELIDLIAHMVVDVTFMELTREKKLLEHPKGYHLDGSHSCEICGCICKDESTWYDRYGVKCITCQAAVDKKIISKTFFKKRDSYYTMFDLEYCFNLNAKIIRRWIKLGILKAREIPAQGGGTHATFFLIKDNKTFLPPKHLIKSAIAKEIKDGKEEYVFPVPWYQVFDQPLDRIKRYGIAQLLVTAQP
ncbi:hypothetical protein GWC95_15815 [Sediminibacterium roseum]|uniref:Uncharacterized protein n=1 Tax=Sediminibacterium roseum TaxID=1978412 RepID=A0ABX0A2N7_9BACT|nr:hypothetical protein [Sediminibacterium roseum]NCI51396.1 hypothetical protein [Sediminibacterium roseum]